MPKVSIIIPVYKTEKYIHRCVDSVLAQTLSDIEVILVDDGSPDKCPEICNAYKEKDSRIKVIHQKNSGVSAARNAGLDVASGEYITFVDCDDYIEPDMYASMISTAEKYGCDVVMCDCLKEFESYSQIYTHDIRSGYYDKTQLQTEYYPHLLMMENVEYPATISNCLCLFKNKKSLCDIRYVVGVRYSEDLLFGACLMRQAESFYYMKGQNFYHYCMNPQSATHTYAPEKWMDYKLLYKQIKEYFGNDSEFDFSRQIDLCLLLFVYNAIGDTYGASNLGKREKAEKIYNILSEPLVREMFNGLNVSKLPITYKQKIITWCYKYKLCVNLLIKYYQ